MAGSAENSLSQRFQIDKAVAFIKEVRTEMSKVAWPTSTEVKGATAVVIVVCIFVAFVIWGIDKVINFGMDFLF